jgi:hypothetical protein
MTPPDYFDEQIEINLRAGIESGIVFYFLRKSPDAKLEFQTAVYGEPEPKNKDIFDRYPKIEYVFNNYKFDGFTPKVESSFQFPILIPNVTVPSDSS